MTGAAGTASVGSGVTVVGSAAAQCGCEVSGSAAAQKAKDPMFVGMAPLKSGPPPKSAPPPKLEESSALMALAEAWDGAGSGARSFPNVPKKSEGAGAGAAAAELRDEKPVSPKPSKAPPKARVFAIVGVGTSGTAWEAKLELLELGKAGAAGVGAAGAELSVF